MSDLDSKESPAAPAAAATLAEVTQQIKASQEKKRKAQRHITQDENRINTELSLEFLNKNIPTPRIDTFIHRGGATSVQRTSEDPKQPTPAQVIQMASITQTARVCLTAAQIARSKPLGDRGVVQLKLRDGVKALEQCGTPIYCGENFIDPQPKPLAKKQKVKTATNKKEKESKINKDKDEEEEEEEEEEQEEHTILPKPIDTPPVITTSSGVPMLLAGSSSSSSKKK